MTRAPRRVPRRLWLPIETAILEAQYPHMATNLIAIMLERPIPSVYFKAARLGLSKTPEYLASPAACRLRRGDDVGKPYRFPKGHVPRNKGLRRPGWHRGRMSESWFTRGHPGTRTMPIGATRLVDGYVYVKVAAVPNVPYTVNWLPLHVLLWEMANGLPVPPGHCLWFRDRNRHNLELANLELITRAENVRRNTIHRLPKPLRHAIQLKSALTRQINRRSRHAEHDR